MPSTVQTSHEQMEENTKTFHVAKPNPSEQDDSEPEFRGTRNTVCKWIIQILVHWIPAMAIHNFPNFISLIKYAYFTHDQRQNVTSFV
jgi:hypothetical protein